MTPKTTAYNKSKKIAKKIANLASEKKANDILIVEIYKLSTIADYFVILSGATDKQTKAIAENIVSQLKDEKIKPQKIHGESTGMWIVIDYGSVVVHIFREEERQFYCLERLWKDAPIIKF